MKVLAIVPAYNEAGNIERVIEHLKQFKEYDYVIINDGSRDRTSDICHRKHYNIIDLPVNLGLAGAFQTGMKYAYRNHYDYAIQFDADGQHRPEYIQDILSESVKGYDIVIGSRFVNKKKNRSLRMFGNNMISLAIKIKTGQKINDPTSGMRMYNKKMIKEYAQNINYGPEPDTLSYLIKNNVKVAEVQVEMDERIAGESYLNMTKSMIYMMRMLLSIFFVQTFRKRVINKNKGKKV